MRPREILRSRRRQRARIGRGRTRRTRVTCEALKPRTPLRFDYLVTASRVLKGGGFEPHPKPAKSISALKPLEDAADRKPLARRRHFPSPAEAGLSLPRGSRRG